jgi:hypothetical protein
MNPSDIPEFSALDERVTTAVATHQRRIRVLTGIAWALGILSFAASVAIVLTYFSAYLPKQMQLLQEVSHTRPPAAEATGAVSPQVDLLYRGPEVAGPKPAFDYASVQATMTHAVSIGTMLIAIAVGLLALGTLVLLIVVWLTRRAALNQIQISLAQISGQLQALRPPAGSGEPV